MDKIIKRKVVENPLWEVTGRAYHKKQAWHTLKTVCIVCGLPGSGKTTYIYEYFKSKNTFYFSFAGLTENLAEKLFADYVSEMTSDTVCGWEDSITAISKKYKFILFDDVSCVLSSEKFCKAFYKRMITNIYSRPFVVFITEPTNKIKGLADRYDGITVDYFSIPEMIKLYPTISKYDILRLCAVSGGIPKIFNEYDTEKSFQDNLKNMLKPSSAFVNFMPDLLIKYFRKPENYHHILCAIANGNHSVSEIGKFIGFAYNKCDTYLNMLITYGLVKNDVAVSKRGTKKTAYRLEIGRAHV
jgi:predicted AAA+ superfamily ATPase